MRYHEFAPGWPDMQWFHFRSFLHPLLGACRATCSAAWNRCNRATGPQTWDINEPDRSRQQMFMQSILDLQMLESPFFWSLAMCPPSSNHQNLVVIVHVLFFPFSHGGHPKVVCKTIDLCSAEASPPSVPLSKRATTRATPGAWHCTCCRVFWTGRPGSTGCGWVRLRAFMTAVGENFIVYS